LVEAKMYDDENTLAITRGIQEWDIALIKTIKELAVRALSISQLKILTSDDLQPYKSI
jgi:hypothetical protein